MSNEGMVQNDIQDSKRQSVFREPLRRPLILGSLFVAALCLRLYGITQPPMEFFLVRQYHGALLARGFYEWLLSGELRTIPPDGIIEPPILEIFASLSYLISGGEYLWIPRLLSALFWMAGGVFLYLTAKKISSPNAAVLSVAFYLLVPYSVFASRAFMPDSLMVMLLMVAIFAILRYHESPSTRRLVIAAVASSLVTFVKPGICTFQVFGAFISLAVYRQGPWRALMSRPLMVFAALSILPTGLYYLYGTVVAGFLHGETSSRKVMPELVLQPSFWDGWRFSVWLTVGYVALAVALLGVLLSRKGFPRALLIGLWSGYLLFGLTFTFHISTHSYYSLQLIPLVALSLGPIADLVMRYLGQVGLRSYRAALVLGLSLSVLVLSVAEHRHEIEQVAYQKRLWPVNASFVATYQEIGETVDHSYRTLILFGYPYLGGASYGNALMYHGRLLGHEWRQPDQVALPSAGRRAMTAEASLRKYSRKYSPEYFIISTAWWQAPQSSELRRFLIEHFSRIAWDRDYVVFDLTKKRPRLHPAG